MSTVVTEQTELHITAAPPQPRGPRFTNSRVLMGIAGSLTLVALWEIAYLVNVVPHESIPAPVPVLTAFVSDLGHSAFWSSVWHTLDAFLIGLGITTVVGVPLGLLLGSNRWVWLAVRPTVEFLRPLPPLAIVPIVILAEGTTIKSKIILIVIGGIWIVLIQSMYGIRNVDPVAVDTARVFGFSRWRRLWHVIVPSALPYVATGIRIASAISLITGVSVELLVGVPGLGSAIETAEAGGQPSKMYALIVAAGILGFLIQASFSAIESRTMAWNRRGQAAGK